MAHPHCSRQVISYSRCLVSLVYISCSVCSTSCWWSSRRCAAPLLARRRQIQKNRETWDCSARARKERNSTMPTLWFILVAFTLIMYVLLDGFDLGAGSIHLVAARTDSERRLILRAIGPVWDGNEVWLIAAAATLFFTFPLLYASSFSGFYLPLIIVLWLLMVRGVAIELRSLIASPVWASFWDGMFALGSTLLIVFYGVALANVVRGVPLDRSHYFFEPLWTDFWNAGASTPGVLDWY